MSIPERLSRIVRHKFSEMKDRFDQLDEEALADPAEMERLRRAQARVEARQELDESLQQPSSPPSYRSTIKPDVAPKPVAPTPQRRTPQQIAETSSSTRTTSNVNSSSATTSDDTMDYHYRMLGLEPGVEFSEVQAAYNGLAIRTDPSRFAPGSAEARELEDIRRRLELSFRALRDALDSTAHRFGLLEFDVKPGTPDSSGKG